jgi:glutathione S-transferase
MRLYNNVHSGNSYKVRLLLSQLSLAFENVAVDIFQGESRTPAFLEMNPAGQTPVLELDDGTHLAESGAILWYLAEGTPLVPADPVDRAQVLRWMFFEQHVIAPHVGWARFIRRWLPADHALQARLPWHREAGEAGLAVMEQALKGRVFFVGDRYTIADIALYGYAHTAAEGGIDLARHRNLGQWLDRVRAQPGHVPLEGGA